MSLAALDSQTLELIDDFDDLAEEAKDLGRDAQASATISAYASDLAHFAAWCRARKVESHPAVPQTIARYIAALVKTHALATIRRRLIAISAAHRDLAEADPTRDRAVAKVMKGAARRLGSKQKQKDALTVDHLREVLKPIDVSTLKGKRNCAILLLGFALASRRSEIAALDIEDIRFEQTGIVVNLKRSKTDQEGRGREVGVPYLPPAKSDLCAARSVRAWLEASGVKSGPLFQSFHGRGSQFTGKRLHGNDIARLVKAVVGKTDLDGDFSGHSLRAGFITECAMKGIAEGDISRVSGHRSVAILRNYVRRANVLKDCALSVILG
jgi:integrase